jgi:hypothetical protein
MVLLEDKGKYYFIDFFFVLRDIKDNDKFKSNLKLVFIFNILIKTIYLKEFIIKPFRL